MGASDSIPSSASVPFKPFVPADQNLPEFTLRAVLLGILMAVVLGAANAYIGLKAGLTVAATFPAAVVAMAVLRVVGGSILEENMSRTIASVSRRQYWSKASRRRWRSSAGAAGSVISR